MRHDHALQDMFMLRKPDRRASSKGLAVIVESPVEANQLIASLITQCEGLPDATLVATTVVDGTKSKAPSSGRDRQEESYSNYLRLAIDVQECPLHDGALRRKCRRGAAAMHLCLQEPGIELCLLELGISCACFQACEAVRRSHGDLP